MDIRRNRRRAKRHPCCLENPCSDNLAAFFSATSQDTATQLKQTYSSTRRLHHLFPMSFDDSMLFVGLDIGGTNIKAGLLDGETGELVAGVKEEVLPKDGGDRAPEVRCTVDYPKKRIIFAVAEKSCKA